MTERLNQMTKEFDNWDDETLYGLHETTKLALFNSKIAMLDPSHVQPPTHAVCQICGVRRPIDQIEILYYDGKKMRQTGERGRLQCQWHLTGERND